MSDLVGFPERLSQAIEASGRTHADIAAAVGVSRPMISMWASGKRLPELANFVSLAQVLGRTSGWLLDGESGLVLSAAETTIISQWRELPPRKKETLEQVLSALARSP